MTTRALRFLFSGYTFQQEQELKVIREQIRSKRLLERFNTQQCHNGIYGKISYPG